MTELDLLRTALVLGVLILLAGCYGFLYAFGKVTGSRMLRLAGYACYALQCVITLVVVAISPLTAPWKLVVVIGTLGFLVIPPVTWRVVEHTHAAGEHA